MKKSKLDLIDNFGNVSKDIEFFYHQGIGPLYWLAEGKKVNPSWSFYVNIQYLHSRLNSFFVEAEDNYYVNENRFFNQSDKERIFLHNVEIFVLNGLKIDINLPEYGFHIIQGQYNVRNVFLSNDNFVFSVKL